MRMDIDEFFVSSEHLEKCSYEVLTRHHRSVFVFIKFSYSYVTYCTSISDCCIDVHVYCMAVDCSIS